MATTRTNKVEVEITASDEATPTIERLERKIDGLESDEARIVVSANTDRLQKQLDTAKAKLDGLDGDEASVQARLVGTLESDLDRAQTLLRQLDGQTGTVRINAVDRASADIDQVETKLRGLDGTIARVRTSATGAAGIGGKTIGMAALGTALLASVTEANNLAGEVQQVADATDAPLDQASRLVTVWKQNGFEVSDLLDIIFQVNGALAQNPELAEQLGVKLGENQTLIDTFLQSVQGVATEYENVAERQVAASTLFGEEGVRQIGAVQTAVGDLDQAMSDLPDAQLVDETDVQNWRDTNEELVKFKGHLQEISLFLSNDILPVVNDIADGIEGWFTGAFNTGQEFREWWDTAGPGGLWNLLTGGGGGPPAPGQMPQGPQQPQSAYVGQGQSPQNVTIVNPPGTPPATANSLLDYQVRNGVR